MKFYSTINSDGKIQFVTTQAEVKALKQQLSVIEVPTDSAGLKDYLNQLLLRVDPLVSDNDLEEIKETGAAKYERTDWNAVGKRILEEGRELDQIANWIMELEGWRLTKLAGALIERLSQLKGKIGGD